MPDVDELAGRLVSMVTALAGRAAGWALRVAVVVALAAATMYLLGLAALDGPVGRVWPVIGAALGLAAVAAPLLAAWRLRAVRRDAAELVGEVRALVSRDGAAQRVVIDTVEAGPPGAPPSLVVYRSNDFGDLRRRALLAGDLRSLPAALAAVTTFPALVLIGAVATLAFVFVSFIFLLALAF